MKAVPFKKSNIEDSYQMSSISKDTNIQESMDSSLLSEEFLVYKMAAKTKN